jgi:hypothetical protein
LALRRCPSNVNFGMVAGNKDGLSSLYYQGAHGGLTTFDPIAPIAGYPAVIYANGGEGAGTCTLRSEFEMISSIP